MLKCKRIAGEMEISLNNVISWKLKSLTSALLSAPEQKTAS